MKRFGALLKTFIAQPVLLTATIDTEELRGKITQDQYTLVLEDLFIGLTKNCPASINFIPEMFQGPLKELQKNYFTAFGHGATSPSAAGSNMPGDTMSPIEAYLDS